MKDSQLLVGDSIEFDVLNGVLVVRLLRERIVYPPVPSIFAAAVSHIAERYPELDVVLDLIWVRYLSSAAITELLRLRRQLVDEGRRLFLCHVDSDILEILRLTHLDELFVTTQTMKEAVCLQREEEAEVKPADAQPHLYACHEPAG